MFSLAYPWRMKKPSPSGWPGIPIGYEYLSEIVADGVGVAEGAGTAALAAVGAIVGTALAAAAGTFAVASGGSLCDTADATVGALVGLVAGVARDAAEGA